MIGALATRAVLQQVTRLPDGGGGFSESWAGFASVWVGVDASGGSDAMGPDRTESRVRLRVTLRRRGDVAAGMRLVAATRVLEILNVLDDGPGAETMTLLCEDAP